MHAQGEGLKGREGEEHKEFACYWIFITSAEEFVFFLPF